jgi:hypothetical protein
MIHNPETLYRKMVLNSKCPQHARISALRFLRDPTFALLKKLVDDPSTPGRLAAIAADMYATKVALKQIVKESQQ